MESKELTGRGRDNPAFLPSDEGTDKQAKQTEFGTVELVGESVEGTGAPGVAARQQWSNPIEFLLSCIAMSVGLGNVWRFPFTAKENGGGAFLIPYFIVLMTIGRPLYFMELALGQFSSSGSVKVWNMVPAARGVGFGQMIGNASVVSYYCCLIALALHYLINSCRGTLPWTICHPELAQDDVVCVASARNMSEAIVDTTSRLFSNVTETVLAMDTTGNQTIRIGSAEQYFKRGVLKENPNISDGIGLPDLELAGCLAGCWVLLFLTLWKGVASSGKVAYFTAIFPYVVLITLLVRGLTLPGAMTGVWFYLTPKWSELLNLKVWYAAVTQSFFSLSTGFGALITYSSYNDFRHNSYKDAVIISVADTLTSFLAGFVIFSILGNLAFTLDKDVASVVDSGPGLAFVSYPEALAKFDFLPQAFSFLFFLMLVSLGLGSATGLTSSIIAIICDQRPNWSKTIVTAGVCVVGFSVGLVYTTPGGQAVLGLVDYFGGGFIIFVLAIVEVIAVAWIYGLNRFLKDVKFMINIQLGLYWRFCLMVFVPLSLMVMLVYIVYKQEPLLYQGIEYPAMAIYSGWAICAIAIAQLPIWGIIEICKAGGIRQAFRSNAEWGPADKIIKEEWLAKNTETITRM